MRFVLMMIFSMTGADLRTEQVQFEDARLCENAKKEVQETMIAAPSEMKLQGIYCMEVRH